MTVLPAHFSTAAAAVLIQSTDAAIESFYYSLINDLKSHQGQELAKFFE